MTATLIFMAIALGGISMGAWIFEFRCISWWVALSDIGITVVLALFILTGSTAELCIGLGMSNVYSGYQILKHVRLYGWRSKRG